VDHQAGGLVDHGQPLVGVEDGKGSGELFVHPRIIRGSAGFAAPGPERETAAGRGAFRRLHGDDLQGADDWKMRGIAGRPVAFRHDVSRLACIDPLARMTSGTPAAPVF